MEKEVLEVNQAVSKSLSKVRVAFIILAAIGVIFGLLILTLGVINFEDEAIVVGLFVAAYAILSLVFIIPFIKGFITIVKSAEYHNAQIESKYDIKSFRDYV